MIKRIKRKWIKCFVISVNRRQDAGCKGNAGVCAKTSDTANLQNELTGALIGLARAGDGDTNLTAETYCTLIEDLFATITNVSFDDSVIKA